MIESLGKKMELIEGKMNILLSQQSNLKSPLLAGLGFVSPPALPLRGGGGRSPRPWEGNIRRGCPRCRQQRKAGAREA